MKLLIISASSRSESQSKRISECLISTLENKSFEQIDIMDVSRIGLGAWNESYYDKESELSLEWKKLSHILSTADAFIFVVPEWNGMIPPQFKNIFLFCNNQELSHKPALIIGISSGNGGVYPIVELRISTHKNTQVCYLPTSIIIRDVLNPLSEATLGKIESTIVVLYNYSKALASVRDRNIQETKKYPYGV